MKRLFDVCVSLTGITIFAPAGALISVLIHLEDRGPVFFKQPRLGRGKVPFDVLKFRTMTEANRTEMSGTEASGTEVSKRQQITAVGAWLRRTGLDEIAQFINVLIGDMSMVGPRPLIKDDITRLGLDSPEFSRRFSVKPGITGPAQIFAAGNPRHSWELDSGYIIDGTVLTDAWYVFVSFLINIFGKQRIRRALEQLDNLMPVRTDSCAV